MNEKMWMDIFNKWSNENQAPVEPLVVYRLFGLKASRMFAKWWRVQMQK